MRIPELYGRREPAISFEFFRRKTTRPRKPSSATRCRACSASARRSSRSPTAPAAARASLVPHRRSPAQASRHRGDGPPDLRRRHPRRQHRHPRRGGGAGHREHPGPRGDPPKGEAEFRPTEGGFRYAAELVRFVRRGCFSVGAAGYPEGHVECPDKLLDWDRSALKVEAGAEFLITQLFYGIDDFLAYEDYLRHKRHVRRRSYPASCPSSMPSRSSAYAPVRGEAPRPGGAPHGGAGRRRVGAQLGVEVCTDLCRRLLDHGVPGIHFYCLNRVPSCAEVVRNLGLA